MEPKLQLVVFNEDQTVAVAKALRAAAEEVAQATQKAKSKSGDVSDVIELLSDSESESVPEDLPGIAGKAETPQLRVKKEENVPVIEEDSLCNEAFIGFDEARFAMISIPAPTAENNKNLLNIGENASSEEDIKNVLTPATARSSEGALHKIAGIDGEGRPPELQTEEAKPELKNLRELDGVINGAEVEEPGISKEFMAKFRPVQASQEDLKLLHTSHTFTTFTTFMDLTKDTFSVEEVDVTGDDLDQMEEEEDVKSDSTESVCDTSSSERLKTEPEDISRSDMAFGRSTDSFFKYEPSPCLDEEELLGKISGDAEMEDIIELFDSNDDEEMVLDDSEQKLVKFIEASNAADKSQKSQAQPGVESEAAELQGKPSLEILINYACPECDHACGSFKNWKAHVDTQHDFQSMAKLNIQSIINKEGKICYQCKECFKKFRVGSNFSSMLRHRITHLPYSYYIKCRLCTSVYRQANSVRNHLINKHSKICKHYTRAQARSTLRHVIFSCPVCNVPQPSRYRWQRHLEEVHNYADLVQKKIKRFTDTLYECLECERKFLKRQIQAHCLIHDEFKSFRCNICEYESNSLLACMSHIREVHFCNGKKTYECFYCEVHFGSTKERRRHLRNYHQFEGTSCEVCNKSFASSSLLLSHINKYNHQKLK